MSSLIVSTKTLNQKTASAVYSSFITQTSVQKKKTPTHIDSQTPMAVAMVVADYRWVFHLNNFTVFSWSYLKVPFLMVMNTDMNIVWLQLIGDDSTIWSRVYQLKLSYSITLATENRQATVMPKHLAIFLSQWNGKEKIITKLFK